MISFELTSEQARLQQKFRTLAKEKLQPYSLKSDQKQPGPIDQGLLKIIGDERLNSLIIPREYGGELIDRVSLSLVTEEISYGCAGLASIYAATVHAVSTLLIGGSDEQKESFLPLLLSPGGAVASCVITEDKGGSDLTHFTTTARLEGDHYIINGTKGVIINAGNAAFYIVWANTDSYKGRAAINAFIVPRGVSGLTIGQYEDKPGLRNTPTAKVNLNEVPVPRSNLIGIPGSGYLLLMQTLDLGRAFFGSICVGLARAAIEEAIGFAEKRVILNRPIIKNQGISFLLAELTTELEAARLLVWRACRLMDLGQDYTRESSMAKMYASELAFRASSEGMQIMGQKGYLRPSLMEKFQRDALTLRIVEGTNLIQKMIIASEV